MNSVMKKQTSFHSIALNISCIVILTICHLYVPYIHELVFPFFNGLFLILSISLFFYINLLLRTSSITCFTYFSLLARIFTSICIFSFLIILIAFFTNTIEIIQRIEFARFLVFLFTFSLLVIISAKFIYSLIKPKGNLNVILLTDHSDVEIKKVYNFLKNNHLNVTQFHTDEFNQMIKFVIDNQIEEFSKKVNHLVAELTKIRVNIEAAIDFSDEDIDIITESRVREGLREITQTLSLALSQANQGMLLKEGMHVVIAGEPNAGKSSLLNALLGSESAIVTSIAGTTRDLLSESLQIEGMPVHITDTAGLRLSEDVVEQEGIRRAGEAVRQSDKILLVIDNTAVKTTIQQPVEIDEVGIDETDKDHELSLSVIPQLLLDEPGLFAKTLVVFNKADLTPDARIGAGSVRVPNLLRAQEGVPATLDTITLSAKLNEGIEGLREALKNAIGFNSMVEGAFVARERHLLSLKAARKLIASAEQCFVDSMPFELAAEDLRLAQNELGRITGQISSDDLLGEIFSNFCVGK